MPGNHGRRASEGESELHHGDPHSIDARASASPVSRFEVASNILNDMCLLSRDLRLSPMHEGDP